jgi:hypothetical protein
MRFYTAAFLALPLLVAGEGPFEQYKAQFQNFLGQFRSSLPNPNKHDPVAAAEAKVGSMKIDTLTLDAWKDTLYQPVKPGSTKPEEWWVLITGRNKTCFGKEGRLEYVGRSFLTAPSARPMLEGRICL